MNRERIDTSSNRLLRGVRMPITGQLSVNYSVLFRAECNEAGQDCVGVTASSITFVRVFLIDCPVII